MAFTRSIRRAGAAVALGLAAVAVAVSAAAGAAAQPTSSVPAAAPTSMLDLGPGSMFGVDPALSPANVLGLDSDSSADRAEQSRQATGRAAAAIEDSSELAGRGRGFVRDDRGFTTVDVPGASVTTVTGTDGRGQIVGAYRDSRRKFHGFVRSKHGFRKIDYPGATGTVVWRINARGQMVGTYTYERDRAAQFFDHGFLLDRRGFRKIAVRGASETRPFGINRRGQIVGEYVDRDGIAHGFLRDTDGDMTTIDAPGATVTAAFDVDDRGRAVGVYVDAAVGFHGFLREADGAISTIDFPGADDTEVFGINNRGQLVGAQRNAGGSYKGFMSDKGGFTAVDVPNAAGGDAGVNDIDDRGRLVGDYDFVISGYLRDERRRYSTFDAPGALTETVPTGLNNRGQIVGTYDTADGFHGFLRDRRGRFTKIDIPGAKGTQAARLNDHEQIVGIYSETSAVLGGDVRGFLLERGRLTRIDVPGAASTFPTDIDNSGRIVGHYIDAGGAGHGFLRNRRGDFVDIDVPGAAATAVVALNDRGQTAGYYVDAGGTLHGFRRDADGAVTTIAPPRGMSQPRPSIALAPTPYGINNHGQIVGPYRDSQFQILGFKLANGRFTEIKIPGARGESFATDIDDRGRIIGIDR
jgi:uncharacterized membrane protein